MLARATSAIAVLAAVIFAALDAPASRREVGHVQDRLRLTCSLRSGAFPDDGTTSVAVVVPPGFDPGNRPGVVVYFHGWNGCVEVALGDVDGPCTPDGLERQASHLEAQLDDAGVNAMLVAVELRVDAPTGDPGQMAQPLGLRTLLSELFREHLDEPLGIALDVDDLDRVVLVAHSGGYQALAGALRLGGVQQIREVVLLDALYGADDVFSAELADRDVRFVDLYTCCGGTLERSRRAAGLARAVRAQRDLYDDDGVVQLGARALDHSVVFKRVPEPHAALPATYMKDLLVHAGFARRAPSRD